MLDKKQEGRSQQRKAKEEGELSAIQRYNCVLRNCKKKEQERRTRKKQNKRSEERSMSAMQSLFQVTLAGISPAGNSRKKSGNFPNKNLEVSGLCSGMFLRKQLKHNEE